ncbi:cobyrinate a,c-diamide synthase [Azospirillum halopraeferens]|uniref:cobyrinate a,c-diamide synthase n=1 Tax=Azospirillum halopraeferens TaxID=34010 RepID=UPI00040B3C56|nr:cobyrinate a,c-diamide synthase [Azospirillum halopraeferens]
MAEVSPPAARSAPGLVVAAPAGGSGTSTVTLGLLAALRARGVAVAAVKAGLDPVAPAWHAAVTGRPSFHLDSWAMGPDLLDRIIRRAGEGAELVLCEGRMGLFDGAAERGAAGTGATADIAAHTGWPVLLVLNGRGLAQSAAALVRGFAAHRPDVRIAGVVLNTASVARDRRLAADAVAALGIPVLGALPDDPDIALPAPGAGDPSGVAPPDPTAPAVARRLDTLGRLIAANLDLDRLCALATPAVCRAGGPGPALPPLAQRIAVAHDDAFGLLYPHVLEGWRAAGAELMVFSPLADEAPPRYADAVYLPGGAPERHAGALAAARRFRDGLRSVAARGPVYGEGGGYAILGEALDTDNGTFPMAGLLGLRTSARGTRRDDGGYRRARLLADHPLGAAGTVVAACEGAHVTVTDAGLDDPLFAAAEADGAVPVRCGGRRGTVSGSFLHVLA